MSRYWSWHTEPVLDPPASRSSLSAWLHMFSEEDHVMWLKAPQQPLKGYWAVHRVINTGANWLFVYNDVYSWQLWQVNSSVINKLDQSPVIINNNIYTSLDTQYFYF